MNLKVLLPFEVMVSEEVTKVVAEAENGSFCMLEHHVDFTAALAPGILTYEPAGGHPVLLAVDEGTVIKHGQQVLVSTRNAIRGADLGMLKKAVEDSFRALDEREKIARAASAKLEADLVRRFLEMKEA